MSDMSKGGNLDEVAFPKREEQLAPLEFLVPMVTLNKPTELSPHLFELISYKK